MNQIHKQQPSVPIYNNGNQQAQQKAPQPVVKYEDSKSDDVSPKTILKQTTGAVFVKENTGNIKDYYKISSCIGRGKSTHIFQSKWIYGINIQNANFHPKRFIF